jgi:hypothetical protein
MVNRPFGRPTRWWVSNAKTDFGEIGFEDVNLGQIDSEEGIKSGFCEHNNEPSGSLQAGI